MTKNEVFAHVSRAIAKGNGTWAIGDAGTGKFMLAVGAPSAVRIQGGGMVVTIGMDPVELRKLRDACDEALGPAS
jgi:hypothetical protein